MSYPYKMSDLTEDQKNYNWIANPRCDYPKDNEKFLIANRDKITVLGEITDEDLSYDYDEFAFIKVGRKYYLLNTTGCSCPSPSETWHVYMGPSTKAEIRKAIVEGDYPGYTLPAKKRDAFLEMIDG